MSGVSDGLRGMLSGLAEDLRRGSGPVKLCKACGREHGSREVCQLERVLVPAKSGRMVERWVHRSRLP